MSDSVCGRKKSDDTKSKGTVRLDMPFKGSDEYFEYCCDPCGTDGEQNEAEGFCKDCGDYLCAGCFKSHSRNKASRHHVLLNKDNMPRLSIQYCDPCKTVGDTEAAAGYCTNCEEYLCENCYSSHTRNKASRQHVLLDKDAMPKSSESRITASVATMDISKGETEYPGSNERFTYTRDFNVKTAADKKGCCITAMAMVSNTELALADMDNKSLKIFEIENNMMKDTLQLQSVPHGITAIPQNLIGVCVDERKIHIILVSGSLSIVRTFDIDSSCVDIKYINRKLYVSFYNPVAFKILQVTGEEYKTITPDSVVLKHCTLPRYIAVGADEKLIYVADWKTNKVLCMDMYGRMVSMYQGELDIPQDITISPFGFIYLCNRNHHAVYKMTSDLSEATVILGPGDGLIGPQALCFDVTRQHLYISLKSDGKGAKVYQWK